MWASYKNRAVRAAVADYQKSREASGAAEPWVLVETLGDELLEEVLTQCAQALYDEANATVDTLAESEVRIAT